MTDGHKALLRQQIYERKRLNTAAMDYQDAYRGRYILSRTLAENLYKYEMAEVNHKLGWAMEDGREITTANREMIRLNNVMSNIQTQLAWADGQVLRKRRTMLEVFNEYQRLLAKIKHIEDNEWL